MNNGNCVMDFVFFSFGFAAALVGYIALMFVGMWISLSIMCAFKKKLRRIYQIMTSKGG
jgi:hypothetical protein